MEEEKVDQLKSLLKEAVRFLEGYAEVDSDKEDDINDLIVELECFLHILR